MLFWDKKQVLVSVCVPVYNSEKTLLTCLESVKNQNVPLELIVVDDASPGTDNAGRSCRKIVKSFAKSAGFSVKYLRHEKNRGAVEARRTALYQARGKYVSFLDSDDTLPAGAIKTLLNAAESEGAHIVHGKGLLASVNKENSSLETQQKINESITAVYAGVLSGKQILSGWLMERKFCGYLWGKLFDRELVLEAFNHIPPIFCVMSEDFLITFWLLFEASKRNSKYIGLNQFVYNYFVEQGISSRSLIKDLSQWEKHCTAASVFTQIFSALQEMQENGEQTVLTEQELDMLHKYCNSFLALNIKTLRQDVVSEKQEEAYAMLCDWWGEDFVHQIESSPSFLYN